MHLDVGSSVNVAGANERLVGVGFAVAAADGSDFWIGGNGVAGAMDVATLSQGAIRVGVNSNIAVTGDGDTVAVYGNAHATLSGAGLSVHCNRNVVLTVGGNGETGALDTVTGAFFSATVGSNANVELATLGATATLGDNDNFALERSSNTVAAGNADTIAILWGSSNRVLLGQNDAITSGGLATLFEVAGNVGATTLANFGTDPTGVVDLLNGVGGYASAAAAFAALTSDGAGGLTLSLGASGAIDFTGATASAITAGNFKIG